MERVDERAWDLVDEFLVDRVARREPRARPLPLDERGVPTPHLGQQPSQGPICRHGLAER
jgi:hypothetical protein